MEKHTWKGMINCVTFHEIQEGELKIRDIHDTIWQEMNKVAKENRS